MKNWLPRPVGLPAFGLSLLATLLVAACGNSGESAAPPTNVRTAAGDGTIELNWDTTPGVTYWLFFAPDASLTPTNWFNIPGAGVIQSATAPTVLCNVTIGRPLYFTVNGRTDGGPGGDGSPTLGATPRGAGTWTVGTATGSDANAVGYAPITSCGSAGLPSGNYVAVGPAASIFISSDRSTWTARTAPAGFASDLFAVAAVTSNLNDVANPNIRYVAVGAGGASIYSTDGATWAVGAPFNGGAAALRGITVVGTTFVAVGDNGTIQTSTDGIAWTARMSNTTANLSGAHCGAQCWAVGAGGTVLTSADAGAAWTARTVTGTPNLKAVVYGNNNNNVNNNGVFFINTVVAVGDAGAAAYSTDGGATWTALTIAGAGNLVGVGYTTQFVAVDAAGNAFTSATGQSWSAAVPTGVANLRSLVGNGVGYVAVGAGGVNASSF